jgi:hypothetical protein
LKPDLGFEFQTKYGIWTYKQIWDIGLDSKPKMGMGLKPNIGCGNKTKNGIQIQNHGFKTKIRIGTQN